MIGTQNRALKIGITGGIGSGKTTVSRLFNQLGVPLYVADDRARWLMNNDPKIIQRINKLFGPEAYINGELNRPYLSAKVFGNATLITKLNQVVHPAVFADFDQWVANQHCAYILKEAALLFESGSYLDLDAIITVDAPLETRISRTMKRDGVNREAVLKRIGNQFPDKLKRDAADFVLLNDGAEPLLPQVLFLHHLWTSS